MENFNEDQVSWVFDLYNLLQRVSDMDADALQREMLAHIVTGFDADTGTLALLTEDGKYLRIVAVRGLPHDILGREFDAGSGIMGQVATTGRALLLNGDLKDKPALRRMTDGRVTERPASSICWPLKLDKRVIGVLTINRREAGRPFTREYMDRGALMVSMLSIAVDNAHLHIQQMNRIDQLSRLNRRLEEAQNQLLQSEKMASIGQLAAGVAHEINNPVGYVNSNLGSLMKYVPDLFRVLDAYGQITPEQLKAPSVLDSIEAIKQEVDLEYVKEDILDILEESRQGLDRVKQIVKDLKDFSHVDDSELHWVQFNKELDSTLNVVHNELKYKAEVVKEYGDLPEVQCRGSQINQVFMNLLVNAAHAIPERGTITVGTGVGADQVWVRVEDDGTGIPPDKLNRIFEPFFTTKPVGKGTGLGLSLSYSIIDKHHGHIDVESKLGEGSRFTIWLPIRQEEETAPEPQAAAQASPEKTLCSPPV